MIISIGMFDPVAFTQMAGIFIVKYVKPSPCLEVPSNIMVRIADNRNTEVPGLLCLGCKRMRFAGKAVYFPTGSADFVYDTRLFVAS